MITRSNVFSNFIWRFFDRFGTQLVSVGVSIVLARLLDPEDYGLLALVTVFTAILSIFIDSGLGSALVQKKDADSLDFSSVFYFNLAMSIFLYGVMFFAAPFIADFYDAPELTSVVRVVSLNLLISGLRNIQISYVSKNLLFKKLFVVTMISLICSACVALIMAYKGFGVWALVCQTLTDNVVATTILWYTVGWRPCLSFSIKRIKRLFGFGCKILASGLLSNGYTQLWQLVIGKAYSPSDLAFYNRGQGYPSSVVSATIASIDSVLFPVMSSEQDDKERVRQILRRGIKSSTYVIMPVMAGLAACAYPLVVFMITEKWIGCVPYLMMFCFVYAFFPLYNTNQNATRSLGRSDMFLAMDIITTAAGIIALLVTVNIGVLAMAISQMVLAVVKQIVYSWPSGKLLGYGYLQQMKDIAPQLVLSIVMGAIVYSVQLIGLSCSITLVIQIPLGVFIYVIGSKVMRIDSYEYIQGMLGDLIKSKRKH